MSIHIPILLQKNPIAKKGQEFLTDNQDAGDNCSKVGLFHISPDQFQVEELFSL